MAISRARPMIRLAKTDAIMMIEAKPTCLNVEFFSVIIWQQGLP